MEQNTNAVSSASEESTFVSSKEVAPAQNDVSAGRLQALDSVGIWDKASRLLRDQLDSQIYTAWIKPLTLSKVQMVTDERGTNPGSCVAVSVDAPNKFSCGHVQRHYGGHICQILRDIIGSDTTINFGVSIARSDSSSALSVKQPVQNRQTPSPTKC